MSEKILSAEKLRALLTEFKEKRGAEYHLLSLGYFGSYARGEATGESDVDVVVRLREPGLYSMVHIKEELEEDLGKHVDIIHYRESMNPFLKKRIDRDAVYV